MSKNKRSKVKRKLNKKRVLVFLIILLFLGLTTYYVLTVHIKNIYIKGNDFLSDQKIIDLANLNNYPESIKNTTYTIQKKLKNNTYILNVKVSKKDLFKTVVIDIKENYPLFYYLPEGKMILYNGDKTDDKYTVPTVVNQIPNTIYDKFVLKMQKINKNILNRISEIQYSPNEVDQERFFLLMNDGNYVYININKFITINKYLDIIKSFEDNKGILYLDSGEYFDIFE